MTTVNREETAERIERGETFDMSSVKYYNNSTF